MRRRTLLALCCAGVAGLAGCRSAADDGQSPSDTHQPSETSASGTGGDTGPTPSDVSVEYEVEAGDVPDAVESLGVTLRVVFVAELDEMTACLRETYTGPYKPTITPIPTPASEACHRSETFAVDLAGSESDWSLGPVAAPGSFAAGHALVVTDVAAITRDGETGAVEGTGGHRANVVEGRPDGPYRVELGVAAAPEGARYDYELVSTRVEPTNSANE